MSHRSNRRASIKCVLAAAVAAGVYGPLAWAQVQQFPAIPNNGAQVTLQPVASGFTSPVDVQAVPDNSGRLIVTDQAGKVQIVQNGVVQSTILDLSSRLVPFRTSGGAITYDERGLFGFAYDPQFNTVGAPGFHKVYTYTNEPVNGAADFTTPKTGAMDHQDVYAQWTVTPGNVDVVDPASRREILRNDHPSFNHDGGPFKFGPDGMLYFALGDGGGANDNGNGHTSAANPQYPSQNLGNAQDATKLLGKILRIDVHGNNSANGQYGIPADNPFVNAPPINGAPVVKEIYAYGLRNVYRFSFDIGPGGTGKLIAGDVGQNNVEEIDSITKGGNYGWHIKEGTLAFNATTGNVSTDLSGLPVSYTDPNGNPISFTDPLAEYDHTQGSAIVGGFVYRGTIMPDLVGKYIFGDYATAIGTAHSRIFYADLTTGQITQFTGGGLNGVYVKGMGQDANGEIYVATASTLGPSGSTGAISMLVPEPASLGLLATGALALLRRRRK